MIYSIPLHKALITQNFLG